MGTFCGSKGRFLHKTDTTFCFVRVSVQASALSCKLLSIALALLFKSDSLANTNPIIPLPNPLDATIHHDSFLIRSQNQTRPASCALPCCLQPIFPLFIHSFTHSFLYLQKDSVPSMQQPESHVISPQSIKIGTTEGSKQRDDGMVPTNEFPSKSEDNNCVKSPISLGIVEVNESL